MRTLPVYHVSESGISLFKLLKSELPGLVREVQSTQVNVTLSLKSHINLITLEKKVEVICRMEDGQTCPDVCRSMKLPLSLLVPALVFQYCHVFFFGGGSVYIWC